jgi:murein DD-endopeptidase MepM/ murein hydrolase activator NlpD
MRLNTPFNPKPDALDQAVQRSHSALASWFITHKKPLSALAIALCLGAGASAVAVSRAPDPSDVPVRQVFEAVQPMALVPAQAPANFRLTQSELTRSTDSVDSLMARLGALDAQAAYFLRNDSLARVGLLGKSGRLVQAQLGDDKRLHSLVTRWVADDERHFRRLVIERNGTGGFTSRIDIAPLVASHRVGSGTIRSSLFAATDEARMPEHVAVQMAEIFAADIDFHRDLRKGDRFHVEYEVLEADGEALRAGRVTSAEFVNGGKTFEAIWHQELGHKGGYYTARGESLRKAYLTSPLEFSRITSGFKMRFHPIARQWRAHLGVDYAAPTGTPARTVGDGVVEQAGWQNGYGNTVVIRHRSAKATHTTLYAHLSRVMVKKGQAVEQGQTIGLVGSTGWSTGPHLHFEFRVDGVHQDPLLIAKQSESVPISREALPQFRQLAERAKTNWLAASAMTVASAQ